MPNVHFISLGCPRNLVDSEVMLGRLAEAGYAVAADPADADVIVVNTCGFVADAVDESVDTILEASVFKEEGRCKRLVVCGCLAQRFGKDLADSFPEVDALVSVGAAHRIVEAVNATRRLVLLGEPDASPLVRADEPRLCTTGVTAWVKIAEGCPGGCTFCLIPRLRGPLRSRDPEDVAAEAVNLHAMGAREIVLVAQDTTAFGMDRPDGEDLAGLVRRVARAVPGAWVRFLYGHPLRVTDRLLETVNELENVCAYFDVPVQHASDRVLKRMGRRQGKADLLALFSRIRKAVPGAVLRTTLLTGFPGETDEDFDELLRFVEQVRFENLGVFAYSDADEFPSHYLPGHVPQELAQERADRLMEVQAGISLDILAGLVGKELDVLILGKTGDPDAAFLGRTRFQAPGIDGETRVAGKSLCPGEVVRARVRATGTYDLVAETE
ncbi:MAG: 30S ribosomal protein S12 methylthiotransferase RimO [Pseudomonadota bacterium]